MKKILMLITFCFLLGNLQAQDTKSIFQTANTLYKNKQYELAETRYLEVIKKDKNNVKALYNLGNTYFHLNQNAKAILYYEKAKKLAPTDENIEHNLKLVNNKVFAKMEFSREFFVIKWFKNIVNNNTSHGWSILFLTFLWLSILSFIITFFRKNKMIFRIGTIAFLGAIIFAWFTYESHQNENTNRFAIVTQANAFYKSKPVESMNAATAILAGTKVEILDSDKNWLKIKLPNDKSGWIERSQIEFI
ncbi:MAG: tetratricopeptide repeat protein [Chitinophagales bacterium]